MGPKDYELDGVQIGRIHSQLPEVTSRRRGLLPKYFGLVLVMYSSNVTCFIKTHSQYYTSLRC